jgi:hypothetical protein
MRKDIQTEGIEHRFTSDKQPSNESKRVPKLKTRIKKALEQNGVIITENLIKECIKVSVPHLHFAFDRAYGKADQNLNITSYTNETRQAIEDIINAGQTKD